MDAPSFRYPGGKHYLRNWHSKFMPIACGTYLEPCAGRGNVFWLAASIIDAERWRINDIATAPFFRTLAAISDKEIDQEIGDRYPSESDYRSLGLDRTSRRSVLLEPLITFSGGGYGNGYVPEQPKAATISGHKQRLKNAARILRDTQAEITNTDGLDLCEKLTAFDFAYIDPPYMRGDVRSYSAKFDHSRMITILQSAPFRWVLAEYPEPEYIAALGEPLETKQYRIKVSGTGKSRERMVTEAVWAKL